MTDVDYVSNKLAGMCAEIVAETGTTVTLTSAHNGRVVRCSNSAATSVVVGSSLPVGFNCLIIQYNSGTLTFTPSTSSILNRQSHTKSNGLYSVQSIVCVASATFILSGDTAP